MRVLLQLSSVAVALFCGWAAGARAQTEVAFRDGDGNWQIVTLTRPTFATKGDADDGVVRIGVFTVEYGDVIEETGIGFDDPQRGSVRRRTLESVLVYLDSILNEQGSADILVGPSQQDGTGPLAVAGPYLSPRLGFRPGFLWTHLVNGFDPSADSLDALVSVDFGFRWNDDGDATRSDEHDLFSALLHEITHALGVFSVVAADGRSALLNLGSWGLFSLYDDLLFLAQTEKDLYLPGGRVNASAADVTSADVVFAGARASASLGAPVPVFSPWPFKEGSSMGHWDATGTDAVMQPSLARGVERRAYLDWELEALADLGYQIRSEPLVDGGTEADAGTEVDAGAPPDAGTDEDAGSAEDAGTDADAGTGQDAGPDTEQDAGTGEDAGADHDAGVGADAGAGQDAGVELDAGSDDAPIPFIPTPDPTPSEGGSPDVHDGGAGNPDSMLASGGGCSVRASPPATWLTMLLFACWVRSLRRRRRSAAASRVRRA